MEKILGTLGAAIAVAGAFVLILPLSILFGYIAGLIIKLFCGSLIANGLNLLFNTQRFVPDNIPMVTATLSVLGGYLKTSVTVKDK